MCKNVIEVPKRNTTKKKINSQTIFTVYSSAISDIRKPANSILIRQSTIESRQSLPLNRH